ncbi:hypothetical protein MLD38_010884 [Melastoma candidum]|uniref:Uncharacterized protein n=1 Tax=Melastoma candidum TaxID=119954 RepID=A0ACB9R1C1_9MYRT|nr:hypothetical protein MLD38_010884 [Melastoma candidum]
MRSLWTPLERKCIYLLQSIHCQPRNDLLQIHAFILRNALDVNLNLLTKFISRCGSSTSLARHARKLFDTIPQKGGDTFLCNAMVKSHLDTCQYNDSFALYQDLRRDDTFSPDSFTFSSLAKCCASGFGGLCCEGLELQCDATKMGLWVDVYVGTGFVDMYAKWGRIDDARLVFDEMEVKSIVSWTALVGGYLKVGLLMEAKKLFDNVTNNKDAAVYNLMIDGYVKFGDTRMARILFDEMLERNVVSWTTMIFGYCQAGDMESARMLFDVMPEKNVVSWNAMIGGYCQNKRPHEAVSLFQEMCSKTSIEPDEVTIVSILPAVADLGALHQGNWIYHYAQEKKLDGAANVGTALVDMFAKCGDIGMAKSLFDGMKTWEVTTWNALINGLALNGCGREALELFSSMRCKGYKPNEVTMVGVLSACNHAGLVKEGKMWFEAMSEFGITPRIEHYGCMIDLLGKAGCLEEAERLIKDMPYEPNEIILSSFAFACMNFKDVTRAERVIGSTVDIDPKNDGNYIMLRNLYAAERRWGDAEGVKKSMRESGADKEIGCSSIEVNGVVTEFIAGNRNCWQVDVIRLTLDQLCMHMGWHIIC